MAQVQVMVVFDETYIAVGVQIKGTVSVSLSEGQKVDARSFRLGNDPLEVDYIQSSSQHSVRIINGRREETRKVTSVYVFSIPGKQEGVYLLPPVSVDTVPNQVFFTASGGTISTCSLEYYIAITQPVPSGNTLQVDSAYNWPSTPHECGHYKRFSDYYGKSNVIAQPLMLKRNGA